MNHNNKFFHEISSHYDYLKDKISLLYEKAKANNKKLFIIIGEYHGALSEDLIEYMVLDIGKKLGINNIYSEFWPQILEDYLSERFFAPYMEFAYKHNFNFIPVDTQRPDLCPGYEYLSGVEPEGMILRNNGMSTNINHHAEHGIAIVGGNHLIGLATSLEGSGVDTNIYDIEVLKLHESEYLETIDSNQYNEAKKFYDSQDKYLMSISNSITSLIEETAIEIDFEQILSGNTYLYNDHPKISSIDFFKSFIDYKFNNHTLDKKSNIIKDATASYFFDIFIKQGKVEHIKSLLEQGCNPNMKNKNNEPLLASVIKKSQTSLFGCHSHCTVEKSKQTNAIVELLLNAGADINKKGEWGTPLHNALAVEPEIDVVQTLITYGADLNIKDGARQETPLELMETKWEDIDNLIEYLDSHHCISIPAPFYTHDVISEIACFSNEKTSADLALEDNLYKQGENIFSSLLSTVAAIF